jgi:hypothetical protein
VAPPFRLWVDTFRPVWGNQRWYHRFSQLTSTAGGFELVRDVLTGHGPLGALYPTNTTHWQKEGDTMTFLYLSPTGLNDPCLSGCLTIPVGRRCCAAVILGPAQQRGPTRREPRSAWPCAASFVNEPDKHQASNEQASRRPVLIGQKMVSSQWFVVTK